MAEAQHGYAEGLAVVATDTNQVTVCSIPDTSFVANAKYWILCNGFVRIASAATNAILELTHGPTPTGFAEAFLEYEIASGTQETHFGIQEFFTQPATAEQILLRTRSGATQDVTVELGQIFALNLDDIGAEGTKYHTNQITGDYTTTATLTDQAAVTFTPNGSDVWLLSACYRVKCGDATTEIIGVLNDTVAGELTRCAEEGEDVTNERRGRLLMWVGTPSNASHTFSLQFADLGTAGTIYRSNIIAINLTAAFAQNAFSYDAGADIPATTPTWTTTRTVAPTPSVTGDWFYWFYCSNDIAAETNDVKTRLQVNPSGGGLVSDPAYTDSSPGVDGWDAIDEVPISIFKMRSLSSGASRTINADVSLVTGSGLVVEDRALVAFSLELPAGGPTAHSLAGVVNSSASTAAMVKVQHPLAGVVNGVASETAVVQAQHSLAGTVAGVSTVSAVVNAAHPIVSTVAGVSSDTAVVNVAHPIVAGVNGAASVTTALTVSGGTAHELAGVVNASGAVTNVLAVAHSLAGVVAGVSSASVVVQAQHSIVSTVAGVASDTVAINAVHPLASVVAGVSSETAAVTVQHPLAGVAAGVSSVSAGLKVQHPIVTTVSGVAVVTADLTVEGQVQIAGVVAGSSSVSVGELDVNHTLAETVNASAGVTAALNVAHPLAGVVVASGGVVCALSIGAVSTVLAAPFVITSLAPELTITDVQLTISVEIVE